MEMSAYVENDRSVIKMVFRAQEVSVMTASPIFAGVSLTVHPRWPYMLSVK